MHLAAILLGCSDACPQFGKCGTKNCTLGSSRGHTLLNQTYTVSILLLLFSKLDK